MIYVITCSADMGHGYGVPLVPARPEIPKHSHVDDWELISTTWQLTTIERTESDRDISMCSGRFVWTWKAIYSATQHAADRIP